MKPEVKMRILTILCFILSVPVSASQENDSLRFEVLLSPQMLKSANINEEFINYLEITPTRFVLLSSPNQFYVLGWGGIQPLGNRTSGKISSYAFTPDKLLMVSQDDKLCGMDTAGNLAGIFNLPDSAMGIISGEHAMYVYDRSTDKTAKSVYIVTHGGQHAKLFEVPTPINSVIESGNSLLLASGNAVFSYSYKDKEFSLFAALPEDQVIRSLAIDTAGNRVYFSTDNMIYGLKDSGAVIITDQFGGLLRYFSDGLIVFNPEKKYMLRILGIEDEIALKKQGIANSQGSILTNSVIINLVKAKVYEDEIIDLINSSPVSFNTSVDSMIFLSNQNVPSGVILAMRNAARLRNKPAPVKAVSVTETKAPEDIKTTPVSNGPDTTPVCRFYIITGSYPTETEANQAVAGLKNKGYTGATVVGINSTASYRIACSCYATNEEAQKELAAVKSSLNSTAWILEKK